PDAFAGSSWFVGLAGGAASVGDFTTAVEELAADLSLPPEASEFSVVDVSDTSVAAAAVDNSALLLGRALMALAVAAIVVGGFGVLQTLARHHTASARAREIEPALGLTRGQQAAARLVTGLVPAVLAAVITGVAALLTARVEPIGAIHLYEPHPGAALNLTVMGVGVVSVLLAVLLAAVLTGRPSGRRAEPLRESSIVARVTRLGGSPPTVLGLRFALEAGRGSRAVPVRSAIAGAIVGVAGVVGGLLFVSSLDRLTTSPSRSATPFDAYVSDVKVADFRDEVLPDPLVGDVAIVRSAPVTLDQLTVSGHAVDELRGPLDIGLESGRMPRTPDEITLGLRLARDLGLDVGDPVAVRRPNGRVRELAVVGLAVIPPFNGEELGLNALLTNEGLDANASAAAFTSAAVEAAPGVDVDALMEVLSARYEAEVQSRPVAVLNLEQLGRLPEAVAVLVGSIAVFALANALVVAVRRRRRDLAVLRALGCTRRETATSVLVMALTIVGLGVIVGVPLGIAIGSTLWRATAAGAFVLADPAIRWELVLVPVGAAIAIALLAAAIPAGQAAGQSPADGLRVE
ncbi:MAG: FtsX-like permease family protein, partial [Acidimicrobiales bacterium]